MTWLADKYWLNVARSLYSREVFGANWEIYARSENKISCRSSIGLSEIPNVWHSNTELRCFCQKRVHTQFGRSCL